MDTTKTIAALFDFDGVIMDTETQYTVFWDEQGRKYLNEQDFGRRIKGQTLISRRLSKRLQPGSMSARKACLMNTFPVWKLLSPICGITG